jgi:hypothetical protein
MIDPLLLIENGRPPREDGENRQRQPSKQHEHSAAAFVDRIVGIVGLSSCVSPALANN